MLSVDRVTPGPVIPTVSPVITQIYPAIPHPTAHTTPLHENIVTNYLLSLSSLGANLIIIILLTLAPKLKSKHWYPCVNVGMLTGLDWPQQSLLLSKEELNFKLYISK